ncbi:MAG: hypothetical protein ACUVRL_03125 [Candidatus Saccharicenans sp.]|uniref:hypothetical protein n=1 Tax=Candidatus Saccharicenans sp. TaxID=2819258 RepID=UPI004049AC0F
MKNEKKTEDRFRSVELRMDSKRKLVCLPEKVVLKPGEKIIWKWRGAKDFPFGVVIKSPYTPLTRHFYATSLKPGVEKKIEAATLKCAPGGHYPYLVVAYVDNRILVVDPEIIVRPPKEG